MQKIVHAAAFIVILAGAGAAQAQERGYVGLTVGPSKGSVTNGAGQRVERHNDVAAFKGYAGYALNQHLAIEGGYAGTTGKLRFDGARFGAATDPRADMSAFYAALRGKVSVGASVDLFAKLGVARNRFELAGAGAQDFDVTAVKPMVGAGAAWRVTATVALTAELEHYGRVREGNRRFVQNRAQVGVQFGF
jgi:hypothetical protein